MNWLFHVFNTREISALLWIAMLLLGSLFSKNIRKSLSSVLKAFFQLSIITIVLLSIGYSVGVTYLLYKCGFWNESMIKDSIFWFAGTGFLILLNINKARREEHFFKNILKDSVKLVLIFEFIVNLHTFTLLTELIILPVVTCLAMISGYAGIKEEHKQVKVLMDIILAVVGIVFFTLSLRATIAEASAFNLYDTLKSFLLPIVLTIAFLPCAYLIALYVSYESLFVRLSFLLKRKKDIRFAKRRVIFKCGFNLLKIRDLSPRINELYNDSTRDDVRRIINGI